MSLNRRVRPGNERQGNLSGSYETTDNIGSKQRQRGFTGPELS
jgi:hypothetical protein